MATPFGEDVLIVVASYGIGCFTAGYYLFRWRTGCDIREHGSGNPGARNVGRLLGVGWFSATLLLDAGKGGLAVWLACYFGLGRLGTVAAMLAVVVGHVWPIQLHLRGGKGVAASLGARPIPSRCENSNATSTNADSIDALRCSRFHAW